MYTPWGYQVEDLPPLLSVDDFAALTGRDADASTESAIEAASAAIRNFCGWHVAPVLQCSADLTAEGRLTRIPARLVVSVSAVLDGTEELAAGQYEARSDGLLRRTCYKKWSSAWQSIHVEYAAGYELTACADLVDMVARIADGVASIPMGVASETAGNVSISYSSAASAIAAQQVLAYAPALAQYRLVGAHAA